MACKDFWKGVGMAASIAALAGAAVYVTKKTLEYMADRQAMQDGECDCGCDCDNYINMPIPGEEDFNCDGDCADCADSEICECATCEDQDCEHCWADREEGVWDDQPSQDDETEQTTEE